jgi:hypothetical protein
MSGDQLYLNGGAMSTTSCANYLVGWNYLGLHIIPQLRLPGETCINEVLWVVLELSSSLTSFLLRARPQSNESTGMPPRSETPFNVYLACGKDCKMKVESITAR